MSLREKMDKLKRVLSGQDDDEEQNIVTQVRFILSFLPGHAHLSFAEHFATD